MENKIYSKVFFWMFLGLLVTFATGMYTSTNIDALSVIFTKGGYWILVILELVIAIFLGVRIHKMKPTTAKICFLLYAFLTGLTFSSLFIVYKLTSIIAMFGVTSVLFLIFAGLGRYTKLDLTKLSPKQAQHFSTKVDYSLDTSLEKVKEDMLSKTFICK